MSYQLSKLPRAQKDGSKLYPVEVLEKEGERVFVHYAGYSSSYDEWKEVDELEVLPTPQAATPISYTPYDHHNLLAYEIKLALKGSRKDPCIVIEVPFDILIYNGGPKQLGIFKQKRAGREVYQRVRQYSLIDLGNDDLGKKWRPYSICTFVLR